MNQFKKWRLDTGLSQGDLAKLLGFSTPELSKIFNVKKRDILINIFLFKQERDKRKLGL